ncbi:MAG: hypothetical protein M1834_003037 [Cirrosporium novae-zelandiae]|nr:MAG: hypothetical protein M1834_003037 [Cirrosporium novae-zelandiae]
MAFMVDYNRARNRFDALRKPSDPQPSFVVSNQSQKGGGPHLLPAFDFPSHDNSRSSSYEGVSFSPTEYSYTNDSQPLGQIHENRQREKRHARKNTDVDQEVGSKRGLHKKTKSTISLKSIFKDKDEPTPVNNSKHNKTRPKKTKSTTNLSIFLPRSMKEKKHDREPVAKDKENQTPPASAGPVETSFWHELATPASARTRSSRRITLNDQRTIEEEIALYTPKNYSPSKQRDFFEYGPPSLSRPEETRHRPKPEHNLISSSSFIDTLSGLRRHGYDPSRQTSTRKTPSQADRLYCREETRSVSGSSYSSQGSRMNRRTVRETPDQPLVVSKRGSRVKAAVAAFSSKMKEHTTAPSTPVDSKAIETAFEALLDARNIPANIAEKMRSVDPNIKENFIKQNRVKSISASTNPTPRPVPGKETHNGRKDIEVSNSTSKSSRSRSKTFSFPKMEKSPVKKGKSGGHNRGKSVDLPQSGSSRSLASAMAHRAASFTGRSAKLSAPEDFIQYLKKEQKPEIVEVGKLHKLRLLLRNETVEWVDAFLRLGGMAEVVGLLHRIMQVEWREDHEDQLLHETLLCLKAMCTTDVALKKLTSIESTLFPALLHMLFDEEKKGPSEFTTRTIIINLLFMHLEAASTSCLASRAETILSYLHDPSLPEESKPLDFMAEIYQPRPYRVWCKEIVNVTKEVFWIFLHHLNVVPVVPPPEPSCGSQRPRYARAHFPRERPPVPAAPYVGGVEWDATNYLAAHLDLLNGLIACLPSAEQRNALRAELRASGFEKCMGGSLRTCKEKFYSAVHDGLKTWVAAADEDGWDVLLVRNGPPKEQMSPKKSPKKRKMEEAPKLDMPKLDLGVPVGALPKLDDGWL